MKYGFLPEWQSNHHFYNAGYYAISIQFNGASLVTRFFWSNVCHSLYKLIFVTQKKLLNFCSYTVINPKRQIRNYLFQIISHIFFGNLKLKLLCKWEIQANDQGKTITYLEKVVFFLMTSCFIQGELINYRNFKSTFQTFQTKLMKQKLFTLNSPRQ